MKIIHLDKTHPLLAKSLDNLEFKNHIDTISPKALLQKTINQYDGIVIRSRFSIDKPFLKAATRLKFVARVGAGLENIDADYAAQKGVELISAPQGNANALGEHTLAILLNLLNNISKANKEVRQGKWLREANRGEELDGKTVGIIGYGNMGKAFARKLKGFDVDVICYDIKPKVADQNATQMSLENFLEKADIVSLHIPQTDLTVGMINKDFINRFKKNIWLVNTARGSCIKTKDLVKCLKSGKVLGAALDVLEYEKSSFEALSKSSAPKELEFLLQSDKVVLTPHIAGWSYQSNEKMAQIIVDKIKEKYTPFR